jgi:signal transduction histidine kinase
MQKVEREAARAAEVVQRLRDFFKGGASHLERITLNRLVEGALEPLHEEASRHGIRLVARIAGGTNELLIDRVQVETVVHSLVSNAMEAIASSDVASREICVRTEHPVDGRVRCAVTDTGPGISPSIAGRLFEPFATTKPTGIGLGLAMSRSMIESHGGALWLERPSAGDTAFCFTLPLADTREGAP